MIERTVNINVAPSEQGRPLWSDKLYYWVDTIWRPLERNGGDVTGGFPLAILIGQHKQIFEYPLNRLRVLGVFNE